MTGSTDGDDVAGHGMALSMGGVAGIWFSLVVGTETWTCEL